MEVVEDYNALLYVPGNINYSCCYTSGTSIICYRSRNLNSYNSRDTFNTSLGYIRYTDNVYIGSSFTAQCIENSRITHNVFYRVDLADILICFIVLGIIPLLFIYTLHKRFKKW